jgi:hypothetical protein
LIIDDATADIEHGFQREAGKAGKKYNQPLNVQIYRFFQL